MNAKVFDVTRDKIEKSSELRYLKIGNVKGSHISQKGASRFV